MNHPLGPCELHRPLRLRIRKLISTHSVAILKLIFLSAVQFILGWSWKLTHGIAVLRYDHNGCMKLEMPSTKCRWRKKIFHVRKNFWANDVNKEVVMTFTFYRCYSFTMAQKKLHDPCPSILQQFWTKSLFSACSTLLVGNHADGCAVVGFEN